MVEATDRYRIREWSQRWPGIVLDPICLFALGYGFLALRVGSLVLSSLSILFIAAIAILVHFAFLFRERYATFEAMHLTTHRLRGRYEPHDKFIAYEDIGDVSVSRGGEVDIAYVGPHFLTRKPAIRHETFHPDDLKGFVSELRRRVDATGWSLRVDEI